MMKEPEPNKPRIHPLIADLAVPIEQVQHYGKNPRKGDVAKIKTSLTKHGQYKPVMVRKSTGEIIAGNHTVLAARQLGYTKIAVSHWEGTDQEATEILLMDNAASDAATYDDDILRELLADLPDLTAAGFDDDKLAKLNGTQPADLQNSTLAERFGAPPFTVLDARQGAWQARKNAWKSLGIESEIGRDSGLVYRSPQTRYQNWYEAKNVFIRNLDHMPSDKELLADPAFSEKLIPMINGTGTSVFDPVLTELLYRWFCPANGTILDPWAGGSVRGLVASRMGRTYTGIELRPEQVEANRGQEHLANGPLPAFLAAAPGESDRDLPPTAGEDEPENDTPLWIIGESAEQLVELPKGASFDMIIGCPPYYDLETYGDDPRDLSNMKPDQFDAAIIENVRLAADRLKDDSYAAFIVGAVRTSSGRLMDMRSLMVRAGEAAGLTLHNDAILVTSIGRKAVGAAVPFMATRVLARTHQDVLIFLKGDRRRAAARMSVKETQASLDALDKIEVNDGRE